MNNMTKEKKETAVKQVSNNQIIPVENQVVNFNAETLIAQAISQNTPVETMEKLLAMRKELKAEWAKEQFDKAMAKFQSEIPTIQKTKKVAFGTTKYSYAPLEDIVEQVKVQLADNGFSFTFDTEQQEKSMAVFCKVKHTSGHTEASKFEIIVDESSKMNKSQQYGSTLTYAKRYAFCNAFGILTGDEDNDANIPKSDLAAESKLPPKAAPADRGLIEGLVASFSKATLSTIEELNKQVRVLQKNGQIQKDDLLWLVEVRDKRLQELRGEPKL